MELRPYQSAAIASARDALAKAGSAVLQMPTGAGKTRVATEIVATADDTVFFLCHRREIIRQAAKAFGAAGIDFGVVSPDHPFQPDKRVQIASVASLRTKLADLPHPALVVWDECHHTPAKSWVKIRERLASAKHLGLTATPERLDGKGLRDWFSDLIIGPTTRDLINEGHLSEFRYFAPSDPDLQAAKLQAGDYRKADLNKVMNTPVLIGDAVAEYKAKCDGKRALVFAASVEASKALVARFNAEGIPAAHVDGTTPTDQRDAAVSDLAAGRVKVLSNVEVFTEGFDLPAIDAVILLRPTKSLALFLQMIGRALRNADGKDGAMIFDHAGLWLDHGWFDAPISWSLDGGARRERLAAAKAAGGTLRRCPECKEVRVERAEKCDCGYKFSTGREIGEYDGQLRELRGAIPEGWVTRREFGDLYGVGSGAVSKWGARGMPYMRGNVHLSKAIEWVALNIDLSKTRQRIDQLEPLAECETQSDFARRHNVSNAIVNRWVKSGLPTRSTSVHVEDANLWVARNIDLSAVRDRSQRTKKSNGYETGKEFANRHGFRSSHAWVALGLPRTNKGIHSETGDEWLKRYLASSRRANSRRLVDKDGNLSRIAFAKFAGVTVSAVGHWEKAGMPTLPNGRIVSEEAAKWASIHAKNCPPFWLANSHEYERRKDFAARVGTTQNSVIHWGKKGLPCASNGWVHIEQGLDWVRLHPHHNAKFDIGKITTNDNAATTQVAAA